MRWRRERMAAMPSPADLSAAIGVGHVMHSRLRPRAHRFSYPVFFLRLPLRSLQRSGWPWRWLRRNRFGLMSLHDADHGDGRPLLAWIDDLLQRAGVRDADGEIWLHTFPRMLGYVFNPVSFWFAHRADGSLRAIVCEVNNTFGERHCYVLANDGGEPLAYGQEFTAAKAFHVSPFCAVTGRYRFRFHLRDLRAARQTRQEARFVARIDYDDADGPLLLTAIQGRLQLLTDARLVRHFLTRPAFTFGVIARIHWQALKLFAKRVPWLGKPASTTDGATHQG